MCRNSLDFHQESRYRMVEDVAGRNALYSNALLRAMNKVQRHRFVSEALRYRAYSDISLPIGSGQTVSRPSTIGRMVQALDLRGHEQVLEVGTGSGYQTAILAELCSRVVTMERIGELYWRARQLLLIELGYRNVSMLHTGDFGSINGSFDAIIVSAEAEIMPLELLSRLNAGGTIVIPIGGENECHIKRYRKQEDNKVTEDILGAAQFVPLVLPSSTGN